MAGQSRILLVCVLTLAAARLHADAVPRDPAQSPPGSAAQSAQCSAFHIGLTPEAALRERREEARQEWSTSEERRAATQTAMELRNAVLAARSKGAPYLNASGTSEQVSAAELLQASVPSPANDFRPAIITTAVLAANDALSSNPRKYSFYDPELRLIAETELTTTEQPGFEYEYVWFGDQPVAQIESKTNEVFSYFSDYLGTPIMQTDTLGRGTWRVEYEPFGNIYAIREGEGRSQPLRLPGQLADIGGPKPDVYYNVHRYYRAKWGRYTQPDPLLNPAFAETLLPQVMGEDAPTPDYGSYAWYSYASDNPVNRADPLGLKDYALCTPTGDVIKDTRYGGEMIMHGVTHSKYVIVRRWCFFRCYCDNPGNCYKIPCLNLFCEKDHGTSIKLNLFDKEGVRPCASHFAAARKLGKC